VEGGDKRMIERQVNLRPRLSKQFERVFGKFNRWPIDLYSSWEEKLLIPLKISMLFKLGFVEIGIAGWRDKNKFHLRLIPRVLISKVETEEIYNYYWTHSGFNSEEVSPIVLSNNLSIGVVTTNDEKWIVETLGQEVWEWINKK